MVEMSATVKGAGGLPGCTKRPGAALRAVIRPAIGRPDHERRVDAPLGDHAVHLGFGLAEDAHRVAGGAQGALGGLVVRCRLLELLLGNGPGVEEILQAREVLGGELENTRGGDERRARLEQVRTIDGEKQLAFLDLVPDLGEQPVDPARILSKYLGQQLFVEVDASDRRVFSIGNSRSPAASTFTYLSCASDSSTLSGRERGAAATLGRLGGFDGMGNPALQSRRAAVADREVHTGREAQDRKANGRADRRGASRIPHMDHAAVTMGA